MSSSEEKPVDDPWNAFELDDDRMEPEPEPGDFWGELDHDRESLG